MRSCTRDGLRELLMPDLFQLGDFTLHSGAIDRRRGINHVPG